MEGKLTTILDVHVVDYLQLIDLDPKGTLERLERARKELFGPEIISHHGRIAKAMDNGLLARFDNADGALECAVILQGRPSSMSSQPLPTSIECPLWMPIRTSVATRLQRLAEPGGICVSDAVVNQVGTKLRDRNVGVLIVMGLWAPRRVP